MRNELTALCATLLFLIAAPAHAAGPFTMQVGGGIRLPTAPESFSDF